MAHEISVVNGKAEAMFAGQRAWHGLGTVLPDAVDSGAALAASGMGWEVEKRTLTVDGAGEAPDHCAVVRADINRVLGVVGSSYSPVQNRDAFRFLDTLLGEGVRYESCGALRGGRRVWLLARMGESMYVKGNDEHVPYMLCVNGHDGSLAFTVMPTLVRVVCANTMRVAIDTAKLTWSTRHLGDVNSRVDAAKEMLLQLRGGAEHTIGTLNKLADTPVADSLVRTYFSNIVPLPDDASSAQMDRVEAERRLLWNLYAVDPKQAAYTGSAFGAWEAVTDYLDHYAVAGVRGNDDVTPQERRFERVMWKDIGSRKDRAWGELLGAVGMAD